ncbi:hypothetical protein GHT06_022488 [Daphnia sinensis]|uniref:Uncharacterized protein n=1 Tax=Daphnia sinensis TaxID=1820382 RepID=A0AAD5PLQ8_9CRUS|nr:hypothetical protein GHT06_022488 [Daphnia sinensis]
MKPGSGHKVSGSVTHRIQFFCREDLPIWPNTYPLDTGPSPTVDVDPRSSIRRSLIDSMVSKTRTMLELELSIVLNLDL